MANDQDRSDNGLVNWIVVHVLVLVLLFLLWLTETRYNTIIINQGVIIANQKALLAQSEAMIRLQDRQVSLMIKEKGSK